MAPLAQAATQKGSNTLEWRVLKMYLFVTDHSNTHHCDGVLTLGEAVRPP